jgi:hypothetical protein
MKIDIDVGALEADIAELEKTLRAKRAVLELIQNYGTVGISADNAGAGGMAGEAKVEPADAEPAEGKRDHRRRDQPLQVKGRQRDLLLLLKTGASTRADLQKTMRLPRDIFHPIVHGVIEKGFVRETNTGKLELLTKGIERAEWFIRHPDYRIFTPRAV